MMLKFIYYYLRSMRLYYGFVTATTIMAGLCLAHFANDEPFCPMTMQEITMMALGFLVWGANQIFSDWCDRKEDAINAPRRPMVTGALAPRPAFALSALILIAIACVSAWISIWTIPFLVMGGALNIAYSRLKKVPVLNCLVYAAAISCCALYAVAGDMDRCPSWGFVLATVVLVLPAHFLMCHNSYYKDIEGDRVAGVRTLQTLFPSVVAKAVTLLLSLLAVVMSCIMAFGIGEPYWLFSQPLVVGVLAAAHFICIQKRRYHAATCLNCQLCVASLHTFLFPDAWALEIASLVAIQLIFLWYNDEKE